ncbi:MAG: hypothetical protein ACI80S_000017 [Pseudohongiellaceae bacterium]|jgi:hypothetical protein
MTDEKNRRRFFRITDAIHVAYEIIDEAATLETFAADHNETMIDAVAFINQHNESISQTLSELGESSPLAAKAITALNDKINTLLTLLELDNIIIHKKLQRVESASVSACGIAFPIADTIAAGTRLKLMMRLEPSNIKLNTIGCVIDCNVLGEESYLRVEFVEMNDVDREHLIQHIMQRQGALLKSLREQVDDDDKKESPETNA